MNDMKVYYQNTELCFDKDTLAISITSNGKPWKTAEEYRPCFYFRDEKVYFDVTEDGAIIEKTLVNTKEEVKVPNTEANDLKVLLITGTLLMLGGTAIIIYGKKKNKK